MFLMRIFYFCALIYVFVLLLSCAFVLFRAFGTFWCFLVLFVLFVSFVLFGLFVRAKSFRKKIYL